MAKAYLIAIEGCSLDGLELAVRRFIRGEVDEHNGKFAPTTAELARAARYEDFRITAEAQHATRMLSKPIEEPEPEYTEEEMAKRKAFVDELLGRNRIKKIPSRDAA